MSSRIPSVNDTFFEQKVLTQIHGNPAYESIQTLTTELKANAGSVPSTLGEGIVAISASSSRTSNMRLSNTVPSVPPVNPGPHVPPQAGTAAQIET